MEPIIPQLVLPPGHAQENQSTNAERALHPRSGGDLESDRGALLRRSRPLATAPIWATTTGITVSEPKRMMVVVIDGRASLPPDGPPRGLVSYSSNYEFDGTSTHADVASNPNMLRDQVRQIDFQGR